MNLIIFSTQRRALNIEKVTEIIINEYGQARVYFGSADYTELSTKESKELLSFLNLHKNNGITFLEKKQNG